MSSSVSTWSASSGDSPTPSRGDGVASPLGSAPSVGALVESVATAAAFARPERNQPPVTTSRPAGMNTMTGKPGTKPISARIAPITMNRRGCENSCPARSAPRPSSEPPRVTRMPVATEMSSALISLTRPSPTVRTVNVVRARPMSMPLWRTPIVRPPTMLTMMITMAAIASPLTNLLAPSIDP